MRPFVPSQFVFLPENRAMNEWKGERRPFIRFILQPRQQFCKDFFFKIQLILHPWLSRWTTILQSFRQFCSSECILHLAQVMWVYPKNNNHAFWRFFESSKEFQKDLHSSKEYWRVPERSKEFVRIPKKERMSFPTRPTLDFTRIFLFMSVQPWNWQGNHSQTVRYHLSSS